MYTTSIHKMCKMRLSKQPKQCYNIRISLRNHRSLTLTQCRLISQIHHNTNSKSSKCNNILRNSQKFQIKQSHNCSIYKHVRDISNNRTNTNQNQTKHNSNHEISHPILTMLHFIQSNHYSNQKPSNNNNPENPENPDNPENIESPEEEIKSIKHSESTVIDSFQSTNRNGIEIDKLNDYPTIDIPIEDRPDWVLIGVEDCQNVFRLNDQDLKDIVMIRKYDPYDDTQERHWYYLRDAWTKSCQKYGQEVVQQWYHSFSLDIEDRVSFESLYGWKRKARPKEPSSPLWNWLKSQIKAARSLEDDEKIPLRKYSLRPIHLDGLSVVQRAIIANAIKTITMFSFYFYTQSYTLYSESLHAFADFSNQGLLLSAIYFAARDPDWTHPYGYGSRRWVVSSLSGGVLFSMGVISIYAGISDWIHPHVPEHLYAGVATCLISFALELYSFLPALKEIRGNAKKQKLSVYQYLWYGTDSATVHVFCEDSAGALCSLTALGVLSLAANSSPLWDAYGSIGIGSILMAVGGFLAFRNIQLLSGQSVPENVLEEVLRALGKSDVVASHHDLKSMVVGINSCVIKIEVNFNADKIASKHINIDKIYPNFKTSIDGSNMTAFHDIMMRSCAEYQTWLTLERSLLENDIKKKVSEYGYKRVHVDIENY